MLFSFQCLMCGLVKEQGGAPYVDLLESVDAPRSLTNPHTFADTLTNKHTNEQRIRLVLGDFINNVFETNNQSHTLGRCTNRDGGIPSAFLGYTYKIWN